MLTNIPYRYCDVKKANLSKSKGASARAKKNFSHSPARTKGYEPVLCSPRFRQSRGYMRYCWVQETSTQVEQKHCLVWERSFRSPWHFGRKAHWTWHDAHTAWERNGFYLRLYARPCSELWDNSKAVSSITSRQDHRDTHEKYFHRLRPAQHLIYYSNNEYTAQSGTVLNKLRNLQQVATNQALLESFLDSYEKTRSSLLISPSSWPWVTKMRNFNGYTFTLLQKSKQSGPELHRKKRSQCVRQA